MTSNTTRKSKKRLYSLLEKFEKEDDPVLEYIEKVAESKTIPTTTCTDCDEPIFGMSIKIPKGRHETIYEYCSKCAKQCEFCKMMYSSDEAEDHKKCQKWKKDKKQKSQDKPIAMVAYTENYSVFLEEKGDSVLFTVSISGSFPTATLSVISHNLEQFYRIAYNGTIEVQKKDYDKCVRSMSYTELYRTHLCFSFGDNRQCGPTTEDDQSFVSQSLENLAKNGPPETFICHIDSKCGKIVLKDTALDYYTQKKSFVYRKVFTKEEKNNAINLYNSLKNEFK